MHSTTWTSKRYIEKRIAELRGKISRGLIIVQYTDNSVIDSFVGRKIAMAQELGVECKLEKHVTLDEDAAHSVLQWILATHPGFGVIIQLPLPGGWHSERFLNLLDGSNDVDVLSPSVYSSWVEGRSGMVPPTVYAVATALGESGITLDDLKSHRIVVCGSGKLVGKPVQDWLSMNGCIYDSVDIATPVTDRRRLLLSATLIISGTGAPHSILPDNISEGAVLIDCGTSNDAGVLQGDVHPECIVSARFMTRTPGGIGPLTVLGVFENLK